MQDLPHTLRRLLSLLACGLLLTACGSQPQEAQTDAKKQAIRTFGCIPQPEECNGEDDDCDGQIDEGIGRMLCQNATCHTVGYQYCVNGEWSACTAQGVKREVCNGVDDDCDGTVDNNIQPRECYNAPPPPLNQPCFQDSNGQWVCHGICSTGTQTCRNGQWTSCQGQGYPSTEVCNGVDDDCDGTVDGSGTCPIGGACIDGKCLVMCNNGECPSGYACVDGYCHSAPCGVICPSGQACINGSCQDPCVGVVCPSGQTCVGGSCQ